MPLGVFSRIEDGASGKKSVCTRLGDVVVDLSELASGGFLPDALNGPQINEYLGAGKEVWAETRSRLQKLFSDDCTGSLKARGFALDRICHDARSVRLHLPMHVGGFTDFYASPYHARVEQFQSWWYQPLGYNSRASSVVVSGEPVYRPFGQFVGGKGRPVQGPSRAVDFELEVGIVIGPGNERGERVPLEAADDHVYGFVVLNDWSARDIQGWEMEPLGPFLGKSFCSTVSPWVVSAEALRPFRTHGPVQEPTPLPYLRHEGRVPALDVGLEVSIAAAGGAPETVCRSNLKHVYWSPAQMVAHHTSNGCPLMPGDLLGTGTASGPEDFARGCMSEWRRTGQRLGPRGFLLDGDTVTMSASCESPDVPFPISFGECSGTLTCAPPPRTAGK